jgi:hypothetical protein
MYGGYWGCFDESFGDWEDEFKLDGVYCTSPPHQYPTFISCYRALQQMCQEHETLRLKVQLS